MTRAGRFAVYAGLGAAALLVAAGVAGLFTLRSEWFRDKVRERIVAEAERASGGIVKLESFDFNWRALRVELRGFLLRGSEPASAQPLFRAGSIVVGLRIVSMLKRDVDLASLVIERPEVNILIGGIDGILDQTKDSRLIYLKVARGYFVAGY